MGLWRVILFVCFFSSRAWNVGRPSCFESREPSTELGRVVSTSLRETNGTSTADILYAVAMGSDGSSVSAGHSTNATTGEPYWTAVKLDADGDALWMWENVTTGYNGDAVWAAVMDQDGSVVLAGSVGDDFKVVKLDADGILVWQFEDGTGGVDRARGIAMGDDGSVVVAGSTNANWDIPSLGSYDLAALKLHANGTLLWKWQGGTNESDWANAVAMAEDGSVVVAAHSKGDFGGVDAGVSNTPSSSSADVAHFAAIKLNSTGDEVWRWQGRTSGYDSLRSVSVTEDGSFIMAGVSAGVWSGVANAGGFDFAAVMLDADGNEVWRWQNGTSGNDYFHAVVVQADGTIALGGRTGGNWSDWNEGNADFAVVALYPDGEEIWRWQGGSTPSGDATGFDSIHAMATGSDGRVILAGAADGSWEEKSLGKSDYMVVMLDTDALATTSPTAAPSPAVTHEHSPAPTTASSPATTAAPRIFTTPAPNTTWTSPTPQPFSTPTPSPAPTPHIGSPPTPAAPSSTPILAGVASAVAGVALIALGIWLRKGQIAKQNESGRHAPLPIVVVDGGNSPPPLQDKPSSPLPPGSHALAAAVAAAEKHGGGGEGIVSSFPAAFVGAVQPRAEPTTFAAVKGGGCGGVVRAEGDAELSTHAGEDCGGGGVATAEGDAKDCSAEPALPVTTSTAHTSVRKRESLTQAHRGGGGVNAVFVADEPEPMFGASSSRGHPTSSGGPGIGLAVAQAADELARHCHIPGVSEAATAVSILANMLTDTRANKQGTEASLRRCRSIVTILERAAKVLGKGGDTNTKAESAMMADVHDAIFDLVELIKCYQSKNRLSQVLTSTLFRRRQEEMGAVVDRAILGLHLGLHVQVGSDVSAVKEDVSAFKEDVSAFKEGMHLYKGSIEEAQSKCLADARRARRQRKLDQIEIPEDHVTITDELLGKGGFGEVFLADYNGRNAAAKILHIEDSPNGRGENDVLGGSTGSQDNKNRREKSQRKAFLIELYAMIRLRSPYTVNVYGAVTSMQDRLVLVMELLAGGDLRTLLKNAEQSLPEEQSRQIIGDICAGMAFLHSKGTVHGDLKSANVLLDGTGRAKIGDFGTSRWTQHTMSTGLATFTTKSSQNTQMSLAWSAPEVLDSAGSTYESDVYCFGIVVWEVLSRELPWAAVVHPRDIYIRVALNGQRPVIPDDAPTAIADVARACWVFQPDDRPTFSAILEGMKSNGWNE